MNFLTDEQLSKLTTPRLLALYKSVRQSLELPQEWENWDYTVEEQGKRRFVSGYDRCHKYKDRLKEILDTREHVED